MAWWNPTSNDDLLDSLLEDARFDDRQGRLWAPEHSPVGDDGVWTQEAWRNNAQLMRESDMDRLDGYEMAGYDREQMAAEFQEQFWYWDGQYD